VLKGKASQDSLNEVKDVNKGECLQEVMEEDYDNKSDVNDSLEFNVNDLFDSNDDDDAVIAVSLEEGINEDVDYDSGYGTEKRDVIMINDINDCSPVKVNKLKEPLRQACDTVKLDEFKEAVR
jgi:hypothetical protein